MNEPGEFRFSQLRPLATLGAAVSLAFAAVPRSCFAEPSAASLQAQIDAAIQSGAREIVLPKGRVPLPAPIRIRNAREFTLRGDGTVLVAGFIHGTAIQIHGCSGLTLQDFTLDFDPLPFTQGTVVSKDPAAHTCEFHIHDGYPGLAEDYLVTHLHVFEANEPRWKTAAPDLYARKVVALDPRRGRVEFGQRKADFAAVTVGDRLVLNRRDGAGIRMDRCENVSVKRVKILSAPGAALILRYMRGENRFTCEVEPGPPPPGAAEPRLMSTCADAFNYAYARRGPLLENCRFSFMGDDSVNLHGFTFLVLRVDSPTDLVVGWPYSRESVEWVVAAGDPVRRLRAGTYAVAGTAAVARFAWEPQPGPDLQARIEAFWPRSVKGRGAVFHLKLARPMEVLPGDAIDLPASSAPGFRLAGCEFSDHRARGARIMASRGVIENCLFRRTKQAAITLGPEYVFWREAGWVEDVAIRGNRLEDCGLSPDMTRPDSATLGAISIFARKEPDSPEPLGRDNRRITIEDNLIRGCAGAGIWARGATDVTVRGNTVERVNLTARPNTGGEAEFDVQGAIDLRGVDPVRLEGNRSEESATGLKR